MTYSWINVKAQLPEDTQECLVWDGVGVWHAMYYGGIGVFKDYDSFTIDAVTHWMPMPEAPREVK